MTTQWQKADWEDIASDLGLSVEIDLAGLVAIRLAARRQGRFVESIERQFALVIGGAK